MITIFDAILKGDLDALHRQLAHPTDLESSNKEGRTPLIVATIEGRISLVQCLLDHGAAVEAQDKAGFSALHFAAQNYQLEIAKLLLESGAPVDPQDSYGNTPLWRATFNSRGRPELIQILLAYGADKNLKNKSNKSPLELARMVANYQIATFFE